MYRVQYKHLVKNDNAVIFAVFYKNMNNDAKANTI